MATPTEVDVDNVVEVLVFVVVGGEIILGVGPVVVGA